MLYGHKITYLLHTARSTSGLEQKRPKETKHQEMNRDTKQAPMTASQPERDPGHAPYPGDSSPPDPWLLFK